MTVLCHSQTGSCSADAVIRSQSDYTVSNCSSVESSSKPEVTAEAVLTHLILSMFCLVLMITRDSRHGSCDMKRGDCSTMLNPAHLPAQQSNVVLPVPQHGSASSGLGETYVWAGATRLGYGVVESVSIHTYEAFRPDLLTARVNSKRAVCERPQEVRRIVPRISATKKSANAKMIRDGRSGKHRSRQEVAGLGPGVLSSN